MFPRKYYAGADLRYKHHCPSRSQYFYGPKIKTPLHVASSKGHAELVNWILEICPDSIQDVSPDVQRSAIHYACNKKSPVEVLELLVTKGGMDVNLLSRNDWAPLHFAVGASRLDLTKFLVSKGANLHAETGHGGNVLSLAACTKNEELARWLIDQGVSPNSQDKQGLTALHRLARFGDLNMTKLFVEYGGADVKLLDKSGCSALEEADRNNMSEIATYLWTKGCESTVIKNPDGIGPTTWFRVRHMNLPAARYGAGFAHIDSKLVIFSGLGHGVDHINHDNENQCEMPTLALPDTHYADLNTVEHLSILPADVNPARPDLTLSSVRCGKLIRLDADGLGGWSTPCDSDALEATIVTATKGFKREDKFGYFEIHVVNAGDLRILTVGLVDEKFPINSKQPGWDKDSYGYHGDDGGCFHNNGAGKPWGERFNPGDVIGCGINYEGKGEVFWTKNGKFLGVSHIGPQADVYYPAIGVENNGAIFRVNFGKTPFQFSFVVPTLTWHRTAEQPEYSSSNSRLIPLPEVGEILAIPDRLIALGSKVWLFNMRTNKWRTNVTIGERPTIESYSQHVRLGNAVYIWNPMPETNDEEASAVLPASLLKLDLEYWKWSNLLTYNVMADPKLDDQLNPIESDDEEEVEGEDDSEDDSDEEDGKEDARVKEEKRFRKLQQRNSPPPTAVAATSSDAPISAATSSSNSTGDIDDERSKLTPKELLAGRTHDVVNLIKNDFARSFIVALGDDLVFVQHMKMLRVNPKTFVHSISELSGTRPKITHHSSFAVGTDIITFGGWDDRKQQNELFILDTRSNLWYKPHTGGLIFPRPRNNHSALYFETSNPTFAFDPSDDADTNILAKHASCLPSWAKPAKPSIAKAQDAATGAAQNADDIYRFCIFAMGWNGTNTMIDIDFVALDTFKSSEALGKMLEGPAAVSSDSDPNATGAIDFDVTLEVSCEGESGVTSIGAHKAILWARSDYFKALLTEDLVAAEESGSAYTSLKTISITDASSAHFKELVKFLYTDHVNVVELHAEYRQFIQVVEKYAPNHVQRLVAEYLLTKVYEREKLNEELGELLSSGAFSDVTFRVADRLFKAHKVILVARSPFFRALLTGGLSETRQSTIDIEDAQPEEFDALLRFLYSRAIDYVNISDYILPLFTLATRCDARGLKHTLESLIAFNLDGTNVASLLILADQLTALSLKQSAVQFIKKNASEVIYEDDAQKQLVADLLK